MAEGRQTLEELFARAGIDKPLAPDSRQQPFERAAARRGKRKAYRYALLYVKHNFNSVAAYREFATHGIPSITPPADTKRWARAYSHSPTVCRYVREIMQAAFEQVSASTRDDLAEMLALNRALIHGDICDLVEQRLEHTFDAEGQVISSVRKTRLRELSTLTPGERMLIKEIRFDRYGNVSALKAYDRIAAEAQQIALLELLHSRGGSDQDWMRDFRKRLTDAREKRIEIEVQAGKVVRLASRQA
jgi:hypothetical protein